MGDAARRREHVGQGAHRHIRSALVQVGPVTIRNSNPVALDLSAVSKKDPRRGRRRVGRPEGSDIVDSGATRSTSGIQLVTHAQEEGLSAHGSNVIETDDPVRTPFSFTNNAECETLVLPGVSLLLGLMKHWGCFCFASVEILVSSPTWLAAADAKRDA